MTYRIETQNHFLHVALESILPRLRNAPIICIIDLASFHSLRAISACIKKHGSACSFIFIADNRIYSRLLTPFVSLGVKMPIVECREVIRHCHGVTYEMVMSFLERHKNMVDFSHKDSTTIYSLLVNDSLTSAARHIGIRPKNLYQRLDELVTKMNMANRLQTQLYFRREFSPDMLRKKINGQVKQSFRMK